MYLNKRNELANALIVAPTDIVEQMMARKPDPTFPAQDITFVSIEDLLSDLAEIRAFNLGQLLEHALQAAIAA